MSHTHTHSSSKVLCFSTFLALSVFATSSTRATAAAPSASAASPVATDSLMKTIREYGVGHKGTLTPDPPTKPDETDEAYSARIRALMAKEDFAQLEKLQQQNRADRGRLIGGIWKSEDLYDAISEPSAPGPENDAAFELQISRAKKWVAAYPQSATARLALAKLYIEYGYHARGTGYANTVSDSQWDKFHNRLAQGKAVLLEAATLKTKDPAWYMDMLFVALDEGWDKARTRELFDQATAFEPDYYHFYRQYANYLSPQWYGEAGDIRALAEEVSSKLPEPHGSILYFYTVSILTCYCQEAMQALPQVSYAKAKQGYDNITRLFGASNLVANRFAFVAATFRDQSGAHAAFAAINKMEPGVWYTEQIFNGAREWANAH